MVNFTAAGPTCLAAFLAGALVAEAVPDGDEEPRWRRVAVPTAFGLAAVLMLMSCVSEVLLQQGVEEASSTHRAPGGLGHRRREPVAAAGRRRRDARRAGHGRAHRQRSRTRPRRTRRRWPRTVSSGTPDAYQARVALGVALISRGELEEARADLDRAVRLFPERPDAYVQRAIARYGLADVDGAREDLLRAQEIDPRSRAVKRLLAAIGEG